MSDADSSYLVEHIQSALAERVGELGVKVTLAAGDVYLAGEVATPERRDAVAVVVSEVAGQRAVHNQTTVMDYPEPGQAETLP